MPLTISYSNPGLPVQYFLDSDPITFNGWGQTNAEQNSVLYRTDSPSIYLKIGPGVGDWQLFGTGVVSVPSISFRYIVSGLEPDLSELTIQLPSAIIGNYEVFVNCQGCANIVGLDIPEASHTTTQFLVSATGELITGDVLSFLVVGG